MRRLAPPLIRNVIGVARIVAFSSFVLVIERAAHATPNFPSAIQSDLNLAHPPPCRICHAGGITGRRTVTTPFGAAMRGHGLVAYDEESLAEALAAMERERVDSVCDGTPDIDDLKAGRDPNDRDAYAACAAPTPPDEPRYGCGGSVAPLRSAPGGGAPWIGAGAVLIAVARRARRGRNRGAR